MVTGSVSSLKSTGFPRAKPSLCRRELVSCSEQQRWPSPGRYFSVCEFLVEQEDRIFLQNPVNVVILDDKINYFYSILVLLF